MARKPKRKVPAVLWRLFRDRARTLPDTVTSLIRPHSPDAASLLLLRPQDPADYVYLLRHCFVVVNHDAPPPTSSFPRNRWSQRHIVQRTAEMMMREHPKLPNAIHSSLSVDLLTDPAWTLLLERVGDDLMIYLLKNTSIFLPVPRNKHYQATGRPVSNLVLERKAKSKRQRLGTRKKRDRIDNADVLCEAKRQKVVGSFNGMDPAVEDSLEKDLRSDLPETGAGSKRCEESLNEVTMKPKKRSRPFKRHRLRKRRQLDGTNTGDTTRSQAEITPDYGKFPQGYAPERIAVVLDLHVCIIPLLTCLRFSYDEVNAASIWCYWTSIVQFPLCIKIPSRTPTLNSRSVVPSDLLGSPSNWRVLRRNIARFIQLRRFERFSLKQCMHKLKTSDFPFLSDKQLSCCFNAQVMSSGPVESVGMHKGLCKQNDSANNLKQVLVRKWTYWLFSSFVVPLVQANFYVTECQGGKQDIYFYRKPIWAKLRNRAVSCLKDQNYQNLDANDVKSIISCRSFGFSKLRLLPKNNGFRWIANLKASSTVPICVSSSQADSFSFGVQKKAKVRHKDNFRCVRSANCYLRDTHAVLKGFLLKEPENLGSSVFDYSDIYRKLCPFIIDLKNGSTTMPDVFIVVADVSKAFDSVNQDKLLSVMNDIIHEDEYVLKQFCQVFCTKKSLRVREHLMLADKTISSGSPRHSSFSCGSLQCVLVNEDCSRSLKREDLLFNLNELVKHHVLRCDNKYYLQGTGIPQGSILSSLLCSLYYGHLEMNVIFPFLEKTYRSATHSLSERCSSLDVSASGNGSNDKMTSSPAPYMLLRLIDDILFVSTSKKQATSIFSRLSRGFRDYNCYMNAEKFSCNFVNEQVTGVPTKKLCIGEDGIPFLQWSGLLLNSRTFEVQADYTRYLNNHLSSSLTIHWQDKPAYHLRMAVVNSMSPKCHPIFFDSNINSAPVVRLNTYQAFLLCAMKFHCYVSQLSYICKLSAGAYFDIITRLSRYTYALIRRRMRNVRSSFCFHPVLELEAREVEWLGLKAFIEVLKRKQSRHKQLISLLRLKLSEHGRGGSVSGPLNYAVDRSHSSLIWKIKY
ncbi:hypothetical protein Tsubulata_033038 [Turnera subulata]|uniref:Telomerase reverse transcriptase n=1 Tax=Turnera subulata TaxID=218843 RepID=A0A9Q0FQE1_9ROSI|nr:hypothetical protein Tsubulata_033038 [Turnera subulata]